MGLPRSSQIRSTFKALIRELESAHAEINKRAARHMERGSYDRARAVMKQGEQLLSYITEVKGVARRLRGITGRNGVAKAKVERRTHWEYYTPVLRCLNKLGDSATRVEIEKQFDADFVKWLKPGDTQKTPKGLMRWQMMVRRCRKALLEEGFIEIGSRGKWKLLPAGRKVAKRPLDTDGND